MKRYSFCLTKKEVWEFCLRAVWEQQRLRPAPWIFILAVCVLEMLVSLRAGVLMAVLFFLLMAAVIRRNYSLMKKELLGKPRVIWVEDGMLKVETDAHGEVPCSSIQVIRVTGHLLMLGHFQGKKRLAWHMVPLRVFESAGEQEAFLASFREGAAAPPPADFPEEKPADALLELHFWVNEEKWIPLLQGAAEIVRAGLFCKPRKRGAVFGIYGLLLAAAAVCWRLFDGGRMLLGLLFLLAVVLWALLKAQYENPQKKIRRQIKAGILQDDVYGSWEVAISEEGVVQSDPGKGRVMLPWESLLGLVETDIAFYFFQKDKKHFVMIPKELSREQAEALLQICARHHMPVISAPKKSYVPGWIFSVLFAALIIGYFAATVWIGVRDGRKNAAEQGYDGGQQEWAEEFDPADYPDYVPLDEQAEVLRRLGLTVPQGVVESVKGSMEEYGMRTWVEGYPYTWLLSELGMPSYDEDWEITGYSDQVFWFDFEGWDIGTDYIEVLEGMKALSSGSAIDSVRNIRENTGGVNWEEGSGEIVVSLEWNKQEYSWRMNVESDWIDGAVLGIYNSLLEMDGAAERFYAMSDDGQGAIVFFCTEEWAKEFEGATGLELDFYVAGRKAEPPAIVMAAQSCFAHGEQFPFAG